MCSKQELTRPGSPGQLPEVAIELVIDTRPRIDAPGVGRDVYVRHLPSLNLPNDQFSKCQAHGAPDNCESKRNSCRLGVILKLRHRLGIRIQQSGRFLMTWFLAPL